jgi:trehalose 6-phosphate phosphatase
MKPEMRHLFGDEGSRSLEATLRAKPLLAFDFDGTLAPLVARPDDATVPFLISQRLDRLARLRPLAIVTGRSVDDVALRLGFKAGFIVGNHGAEESGIASAFETAVFDFLRARIEGCADELQSAGIQVEDKRYSLALHYRRAIDQRQAIARIESLIADLPAVLRIVPGKCVYNVVVADAPDKCDAVASLVRRAGCDSAIFVGDDINDETVFARAPDNWLTVRVGLDDPRSQAAFFLDGYADIALLLDRMLGVLEPR